jgi:hypothetical protein
VKEIRKCLDYGRGQILGACLAAASVTKTVTLLSVSSTTVSKIMSTYTNHWKAISVKRNSGQKLTFTGTDCHTLRRTVLKNYILQHR